MLNALDWLHLTKCFFVCFLTHKYTFVGGMCCLEKCVWGEGVRACGACMRAMGVCDCGACVRAEHVSMRSM